MNVKSLYKFAILTISLFLFSSIVTAQKTRQEINETDYCALFNDELKDYKTEAVTTVAYMTYSTVSRVDGDDTFLYFPACNNGDFFSVIELSKEKKLWKKWKHFFFNLPGETNYIFEVKLTGKLESSVFPAFGSLAWSRNQFNVIAIESAADITKTAVKPDFESNTTVENLRDVNDEIMSYFMGKKKEIGNYFADEFVISGLQENIYNKKNFHELADKGLFGNIKHYKQQGTNSGQFKYQAGSYKVLGYVFVIDENDKPQSFDFENTYRYTNKSWILTKIELTKSPGF